MYFYAGYDESFMGQKAEMIKEKLENVTFLFERGG